MVTGPQIARGSSAPKSSVCRHEAIEPPNITNIPHKREGKARPAQGKPASGEVGMRWFPCSERNTLHIIGPCPRCRDTKWGLLLGTTDSSFSGLVRTRCAACDNELDYYVDAQHRQIWRREHVEPIRDQTARSQILTD